MMMSFNYIIKTGYNDLDHLVPFIYQASNEAEFNHTIWLTSVARRNQKVWQLLKIIQRDNVHINETFNNVLSKFVTQLLFNLESKIHYPLVKKVVIRVKNYLLSKDEAPITKALINSKTSVFITANPGLHKNILTSSSKRILFPHGFGLCQNKLLMIDQLKRSTVISQDSTHFDLSITTDLINAAPSQVRLGSLRFQKKWMEIKRNFEPKFSWQMNSRLKIAFIDPKDHVNTFKDEFWRSCEVALGFENCSVAMINRGTQIPKNLSKALKKSPHFIWVPYDVPTSSIIDWADIIIHNGTTLHAECIVKKKPVILPRYLSCNKTFCEIYKSAFIAETRDELYDYLDLAHKDFKKFKNEYSQSTNANDEKYSADFFYTNDNPYHDYLNEIKKVVNT